MASFPQSSQFSQPLKPQDGPYQIELEDIESDETTTSTRTDAASTTGAAPKHTSKLSTSPMKTEGKFVTGFTTAEPMGVEAAPPSLKSTYMVRACVCAFAILLLWITSLNLSKLLVTSIILSPSLTTVSDSWTTLSADTIDASALFADCGTSELSVCNKTLERHTNNKLAEIALAQQQNQVTLFEAASISSQCNSLALELINSVHAWTQYSPSNVLRFNATCTSEEQAEISSMVQSQNVVDNKAFLLANSYSADVDSRSARMVDYAQNFTAYNKWYFNYKLNESWYIYGNLSIIVPHFTDILGNITASLAGPADHLVSCVSFQTGANVACPDGAYAAWLAGSAPVKSAYQNAQLQWLNTYNLYHSVTDSMLDVLNAVNTFYNDVLKPAQTGLASLGISLGGFPSTYFKIPSAPVLPSSFPTLQDPGFYDVNFTRHYDDWSSSVAAATAKTRAAAGSWWANQSAIADPLVPNYFSDYNPPDYVGQTESENEQQQQESDNYRVQTAYALNQANQLTISDLNITSAVTTAGGFLSDQEKSLSLLSFDIQPLGGNLLLAPLLNVIPNLYFFALVIDYLWRGYRSVHLIIKYWFKSAVGLPQVDVRSYESNEGQSGPVKAVAFLTHPCTIVSAICLVLVLGLISLIPPYLSLYDAYVTGCVTEQTGTVLTNNTYSIAFNYAQSDGEKIITTGLQKYDSIRNEICGQHLQATADQQNQDATTLASSKQSQSDSYGRVTLFQKCLNFSIFGAISTYNATFGHRHPLTIINDALDPSLPPTVSVENPGPCLPATIAPYVLEPAVFNCSLLPACEMLCAVGQAELIIDSKNAGCNTEYLVHSFIARLWITILVFICLNISRMLFMAAVVRIGWRSLTPKGFEFVSNCTRIGETSSTINAELVKELNKSIANFERFAVVLFGLAILVHIPYIVVLSTVNQTIAYH